MWEMVVKNKQREVIERETFEDFQSLMTCLDNFVISAEPGFSVNVRVL